MNYKLQITGAMSFKNNCSYNIELLYFWYHSLRSGAISQSLKTSHDKQDGSHVKPRSHHKSEFVDKYKDDYGSETHQTNIDEPCTLAIIAHSAVRCSMPFNLNRHPQPKRLFLIRTDARNISQTKPHAMDRPSQDSSYVLAHVPHRKHKHLTGIHIKTCITRHPSRSSNYHTLRLPQVSRHAVTKCREHKPVHY